jgi:hypothetical protein
MRSRMAVAMDRKPLEWLVILLVWVALYLAYDQLGMHKRIPRNVSETAPIVTATRLPFRFRLRTLLVATALVAVLLGAVLYAVSK